MKIGVDIRTLTENQYSGVSEYTSNLLTEILEIDNQNDYRFFYNSFRDLSDNVPDFENKNLEIIKTNYPNKIFNWAGQKILNYPKVDEILDVDIFFEPNLCPIALNKNTKSILTVHDISFFLYPEFFSQYKVWWHRVINPGKMFKNFSQIITVSESTKRDLISFYGIDTDKIKVIYPAVKKQYRVVDKDDIRLREIKEKYNLPEKFILFLGTIEPRKNIIGLVNAYEKIKKKGFEDIKLVIAGGSGWKNKKIFEKIEKSPYKDDIRVLGYVDDEDKVYLYNLAELFIYPSFYEGFGFPVLEAMASGTPVISSTVSSIPEVMGNAGILIDPDNEQEMAMAIFEIIKNDKIKQDLIEKGLKRANNFSWEKTAREFLDFIKEI